VSVVNTFWEKVNWQNKQKIETKIVQSAKSIKIPLAAPGRERLKKHR
jgi:hypothetical protein